MNEQRRRGISGGGLVVGGKGHSLYRTGKLNLSPVSHRTEGEGMGGDEEVSKLQFTIYGNKHVDRVIWQIDICVKIKGFGKPFSYLGRRCIFIEDDTTRR